MWRALFISLGLYAVILGVECLLIEKAVLAPRDGQGKGPQLTASRGRDFIPPDWAPWSLMSTGAVTMLYSVTIPKRNG